MKAGWIFCTVFSVIFHASATEDSVSVFERPSPPPEANQIDKIVFSKLEEAGLKPALCTDEVFIRRIYLDVIGKIPTEKEVVQFLDTPYSKSKRSELIDELMAREEFADYWSMKWGDILRIKAEFPINLWPNGAQVYHRWVRESIAQNKPYDLFVRELLTSNGSNFRVGPVNFYRALQNKTPEGIATAAALTFMGVRTESWPKERLENMTVFFSRIGYKPTSEWKEENVFWDPFNTAALKGNSAPGKDSITTVADGKEEAVALVPPGPVPAVLPDGKKVQLAPDRDPRVVFADWLISADNPWFSRCIVNRVWAWLLGRGIIHQPDDIREDNPPSNPELLAWLEQEFIASRYDLNHLYRLILNSKTYQLSPVSHCDIPDAAARFAFYPVRRLEAEVLIDAINQITGSSDLYTSAIPEPFTYIPKNQSAVSIADGSIISPFLALFGRSARATGLWDERNDKTTAPQRLHLLNSGHIQEKIEKGQRLQAIFSSKIPPEKIIDRLYLTLLSRHPTEEEIKTCMEYIRTTANAPDSDPAKKQIQQKQKNPTRKQQEGWVDITWALINSPEFLYRH